MSELKQAINEMRNMRESYDQLAGAAEAYNTGKVQLAQNITSKGVEASASETLPELADKVAAISQETYEINGGEMYAKQLFGSLETPNYWNLYDVLAQLLSDGRLVSYGGILLAEYYRGYDSLALAGAGAGGAYVVSDKDENGQFKMYTEDTTHTWATEFDGKGNRWVAYCFADEYHDFQITDTNTSPRSIFIGRKVGNVICLVNGRMSEIVVPDGNELKDFQCGGFACNFGRVLVMKNIQYHASGNLIQPNQGITELTYVQVKDIAPRAAIKEIANPITGSYIIELGDDIKNCFILYNSSDGSGNKIPLLIIRGGKKISNTAVMGVNHNNPTYQNGIFVMEDTEELVGISDGSLTGNASSVQLKGFKRAYFKALEKSDPARYGTIACSPSIEYIYFGFKSGGNDKTKQLLFRVSKGANLIDIELKEGYCKSIEIGNLTDALTEANMYAHILQRLKQDEPDCGDDVTITLGATNLAKLTSQESQDLLAELRGTYGYTFA